MEIKVELTGLAGVEDALASAGPKIAKRALRKALQAGANEFVQEAKRRAPVLVKGTPQRRPGELRDSIKSTVKLSPKQESGRARVGPAYTDKGPDDPGVWGLFVEVGTEDTKAVPYLRPAFDHAVKTALDAETQVLRDAVDDLKAK